MPNSHAQPAVTAVTAAAAAAEDPAALRRRYMLAAIRLAQPGDPARLNDRDLFDLFAMLGEPEFLTWREQVGGWETWQRRQGVAPEWSGVEEVPAGPLTHREFDAQLRRQRV